MANEIISPDDRCEKKPLLAITRLLKPKIVLELGSYNGRDSVGISELCERIVCVEGRAENVVKTREALDRHTLRVAVFEVVLQDIREYLIQPPEQFDLVWASGVLYHFDDPITVIRQLAELDCPMVGWTHLAGRSEAEIDGFEGFWFTEDPENSVISSIKNSRSFWMTPISFERAFRNAGFDNFAFLGELTLSVWNSSTAYFVASRSNG